MYALHVFSGVQEAHASPAYPCEDVSQYYFGLDGAQGSALMHKLNTLVSGHTSLPYKHVGGLHTNFGLFFHLMFSVRKKWKLIFISAKFKMVTS